MILEWNLSSNNPITFFDRGIPDVIAYLKIASVPVPGSYEDSLVVHPYQKKVFILPPWKNIYVNDSERWQSFEESKIIYHAIQETYNFYGYELIEVPLAAGKERVRFVLDAIAEKQ